ncbi:MAG: porin [Pirellulales bacterium]|nr:porin [Pirellulales bacterium]
MRQFGLALFTLIGVGGNLSAGDVRDAYYQAGGSGQGSIAQVAFCDCEQPACGCEAASSCCDSEPSCDSGCDGGCDGGCDSCCSSEGPLQSLLGDGLLGRNCCLKEPFALFGEHCGYEIGGWVQLGYHNAALPLFNSRPDDYQLQQSWVYFEKAIDTSCGFDIGGRLDYIYGTDGPDTQAFGINNNHWDNQWDNGGDYGHAIPQAYLEAGYGDLSVKVGHFYTIIGYEVVGAPGNFFYSHAYTFFNSEPFTHSGFLATYNLNEDVDVYGGYVLGWDSGFEDNGDAFLGGSSVALTDDITLTSTSTFGRFADNAGGDERGYMQSLVADVTLTDKLQYVLQSDYLDTENNAGQTVRETFGINQYLFYQVNDCVSYGMRFEWWNVEADSQGFYGPNAVANFIAPGDYDIFALTLGLNYKPHANVIIRPEIRWDWVDGSNTNLASTDFGLLEDNDDRQTTFGIDSIFLF